MRTYKDKEYRFNNCNLRFLGTKMDINGNGRYIFKYPNSRAFALFAINFWNGSNFRLVKYPGDFFTRFGVTPEELEKEVIGYITVFGTKKQKEGLRIYKK